MLSALQPGFHKMFTQRITRARPGEQVGSGFRPWQPMHQALKWPGGNVTQRFQNRACSFTIAVPEKQHPASNSRIRYFLAPLLIGKWVNGQFSLARPVNPALCHQLTQLHMVKGLRWLNFATPRLFAARFEASSWVLPLPQARRNCTA